MINIKLEYGGDLWTMRDKLLTAIAGGSAPDLGESYSIPFNLSTIVL